MTTVLLVLAGVVVGWAIAALVSMRARGKPIAQAVIVDPERHTTMSPDGAVRSVQAADLFMPEAALDAIWSPMHLERLARTYWRFLSRVTLGLIRVAYTEHRRFVVLIARPLVLLSFEVPEYAMDAERGIVRWRIRRGLLVSRGGRGKGYLQIDIRRRPGAEPGNAVLHVENEIAYFYPSIASAISTRVYKATQSRIHVLVTHAFLRSLVRLDLVPSRVGRFATIDEVPDPPAGAALDFEASA